MMAVSGRRVGLVLSGLVVGVLALSGCSSSPSPDPSSLVSPSSSTSVPAGAATASAPASRGSNSPSAAGTSSAAATSSAGSRPTAGSTRITVRIAGCEGCGLVLWNGRVRQDTRIIGRATVRSGVAVVVVRTSDTVGLGIAVDHPRLYGAGNSAPVVVMSYGTPGQVVTPAIALASEQGYYCWAGTAAPAATFRLATMVSALLPPPDGRILAVYSVPSVASLPGSVAHKTFHGALGVQDAPYCTAP